MQSSVFAETRSNSASVSDGKKHHCPFRRVLEIQSESLRLMQRQEFLHAYCSFQSGMTLIQASTANEEVARRNKTPDGNAVTSSSLRKLLLGLVTVPISFRIPDTPMNQEDHDTTIRDQNVDHPPASYRMYSNAFIMIPAKVSSTNIYHSIFQDEETSQPVMGIFAYNMALCMQLFLEDKKHRQERRGAQGLDDIDSQSMREALVSYKVADSCIAGSNRDTIQEARARLMGDDAGVHDNARPYTSTQETEPGYSFAFSERGRLLMELAIYNNCACIYKAQENQHDLHMALDRLDTLLFDAHTPSQEDIDIPFLEGVDLSIFDSNMSIANNEQDMPLRHFQQEQHDLDNESMDLEVY